MTSTRPNSTIRRRGHVKVFGRHGDEQQKQGLDRRGADVAVMEHRLVSPLIVRLS
ncbi:hypothetical protein Ae168Ps1_4705 [Pseudonocardia sp. Ae168_Ps1]|nr:hypothetical protein Ae150APs1_4678 [Pseudonocardia sp. Ae150A_Ps1]OLL82299.1 hypothetical protein Ae168Ps1_4705 [Pseudonocardia sp. Ae168_Ps1]OLL83585.1 hypothetical protein Ae263Ps1_0640c [Pseudonocardia sp. Ae263_Ps1]OLL90375.1 hypothetical protein Ae356Ps1_0272 [Pseudonocardia sp. Ae356_Ps1]